MTFIELASLLASLAAAVLALEYLAPQRMARLWLALERRRAGLTLKRQRLAGGIEMPYLEGGRGEPLVLVHGFGGDKDNFTRVAGLLVRHHRVIIPDLPGFGDATRDLGARYTVADQVERLQAFAAALGLDTFHLGGNSMGGFIAAEFAARHAHRVASLWLLDPAGTAAAQDTPIVRSYLAGGDFPLLLKSTDGIAPLLKAITSRPPLLPPSVKAMLARRAVADHALHAAILDEVAHGSPTLEERLPYITAPTLIVWGTEDKVLSPQGAAVLHERLPHSRVVLMPGIGHVPMMEAPRAVTAEYLRFRADLRPTASGAQPMPATHVARHRRAGA